MHIDVASAALPIRSIFRIRCGGDGGDAGRRRPTPASKSVANWSPIANGAVEIQFGNLVVEWLKEKKIGIDYEKLVLIWKFGFGFWMVEKKIEIEHQKLVPIWEFGFWMVKKKIWNWPQKLVPIWKFGFGFWMVEKEIWNWPPKIGSKLPKLVLKVESKSSKNWSKINFEYSKKWQKLTAKNWLKMTKNWFSKSLNIWLKILRKSISKSSQKLLQIGGKFQLKTIQKRLTKNWLKTVGTAAILKPIDSKPSDIFDTPQKWKKQPEHFASAIAFHRTGIGLESDWIRDGIGLELDWNWNRIGTRLQLDWSRIGLGLELDWSWIEIGWKLDGDWTRVRLELDWHWIDIRIGSEFDRHWIGIGTRRRFNPAAVVQRHQIANVTKWSFIQGDILRDILLNRLLWSFVVFSGLLSSTSSVRSIRPGESAPGHFLPPAPILSEQISRSAGTALLRLLQFLFFLFIIIFFFSFIFCWLFIYLFLFFFFWMSFPKIDPKKIRWDWCRNWSKYWLENPLKLVQKLVFGSVQTLV